MSDLNFLVPARSDKFSVRFYDSGGFPFAEKLSRQITEIDSTTGNFVFEVPAQYGLLNELLALFFIDGNTSRASRQVFSMAIFVPDGTGITDKSGSEKLVCVQLFKEIRIEGMKLNDVQFHYSKSEPIGIKIFVSKPSTKHPLLVICDPAKNMQESITNLLTS